MNHAKVKQVALRLISPLHRANRQLAIYLDSRFARLGVSAPEAHIVAYLHAYGPCAIGELVRVFGYKAPTMTGMLDRLEKKSLVRRELNPSDRRSFVVTVAEEGVSLAKESRGEVEKLDRRIRRRVSAGDIRGFQNVIDAIAEITGIDVRRDGQGASPKPRRQ